jgi:replicative DNA helicase
MATWEIQLISRIVRTGELNTVLQWGITEADFLTLQGRGMWRALYGYHISPETSGSVMGPEAVQHRFPNFVLHEDFSMTTEALCKETRKARLAVDYKGMAQQGLELVDHDPMQAISHMQSNLTSLQNIGMSQNTDVHFYKGFSERMRRYEMIKAGVDLSCGRWPWHPLQEATMGVQPDDYVIFFGRPKSMKTWVLAYLIAWFYEMRKRILIYTKEMTPENIFWRVGACLAEVRYAALNSATLTWEEEQMLYTVERMLYLAQAAQTVVCLSGADAAEGGDNVPWLRSKVEQYHPEMVFIDGLYLMSDARGATKDHARVRNISRGIRQMNLETRIPVIGTLQANRAAAGHQEANLDEIAFSDAIGQDATMIFRTINEKNKPTVALVVGGSREFDLSGFRIYGVPAVNFNYAGPLSESEALSAKEEDDAAEEKKKKAAAKKAARVTPAKAVKEVGQHPAVKGI